MQESLSKDHEQVYEGQKDQTALSGTAGASKISIGIRKVVENNPALSAKSRRASRSKDH